MRQVTIIEPAKTKYSKLTGQKRVVFNRIVLGLARLKEYKIKDEIVNIVLTPSSRKQIHYNDSKHFEIAFAIETSGEMVIADFKCLF